MPLVCGCIIYSSIKTDDPVGISRDFAGVFALLSVLVIFIESGSERNII
ncbi:Uncharacterised protein [Klebsiella michiganensis]|nr:Uncharacterised protein [Klebsiella michiganensis]